MMATPLDLPTPVAPRMAKCRLTRWSMSMCTPIFGVLLQVADMGVIGVGDAVDQAQFALRQQHGGVADSRDIR